MAFSPTCVKWLISGHFSLHLHPKVFKIDLENKKVKSLLVITNICRCYSKTNRTMWNIRAGDRHKPRSLDSNFIFSFLSVSKLAISKFGCQEKENKVAGGHRQRKGCRHRHRRTNILFPAFYLIWFFEEKKKTDLRIAEMHREPNASIRGLWKASVISVSLWCCAMLFPEKQNQEFGFPSATGWANPAPWKQCPLKVSYNNQVFIFCSALDSGQGAFLEVPAGWGAGRRNTAQNGAPPGAAAISRWRPGPALSPFIDLLFFF